MRFGPRRARKRPLFRPPTSPTGDGGAAEARALPQPHQQLHVAGLRGGGDAAAALHARGDDPQLLAAPERHGRDLAPRGGRSEQGLDGSR